MVQLHVIGFHPRMLGTDNNAFLKETEDGSRWMEKFKKKTIYR